MFELITGVPPFTSELPEVIFIWNIIISECIKQYLFLEQRIFENILNMKIPWPEVPEEMSSEAKDLIERFVYVSSISSHSQLKQPNLKKYLMFFCERIFTDSQELSA